MHGTFQNYDIYGIHRKCIKYEHKIHNICYHTINFMIFFILIIRIIYENISINKLQKGCNKEFIFQFVIFKE